MAAAPAVAALPTDAYLDGLPGLADVSELRLRLQLVTWLPGASRLLPPPHQLVLRKLGGALRVELVGGESGSSSSGGGSGGGGSSSSGGGRVYVLSTGPPHARTPRGTWALSSSDCVAREVPSMFEALRARAGGEHGVLAEVERLLPPGASQAVAGAAGAIARGASSATAWAGGGVRSLLWGKAAAGEGSSGAGAGRETGGGAVVAGTSLPPAAAGSVEMTPAVASSAGALAAGAAAAMSSAAALPLVRAAAAAVPAASTVPAPLLLPLVQLASACPLGGPLGGALSVLATHLGGAATVAAVLSGGGARVPVSLGVELAVAVEAFALGDPGAECVEVPVGWAVLKRPSSE